jgi:hypothetical protein
MPTSSGAHARALKTAPGIPAPSSPTLRDEFSSIGAARPASYASSVGDCVPIPGDETEYVLRHAPGLQPSVPSNAPTRPASAATAGELTQIPPDPVPAVSEDAPEGGWAVSPHAIYTEIQVLRSEVVASGEEEGRLREEVLELRTLVAVLDAVVPRHAAQQAPSGADVVRCTRMKKTSLRGDVPNLPNRHKTSHDPECSSTSREEASDEDADEAPTRDPQGRRVSGLKEQTTRRPEFKRWCHTVRIAWQTRRGWYIRRTPAG